MSVRGDRDGGGDDGPVVVLAGGTGGAKLAAGFAEALGPERVTVIANTGDDIEIYGAYVSPDPDLVCFWLAGRIDARGWGLEGDTFAVMDGLRELGFDVWFNLGDRDLAWCVERARLLAGGISPGEAIARLARAIGVRATVLPMCERPVRTWVRTREAGWRSFQEYMIRDAARGELTAVEYRGAEQAHPGPQVVGALDAASVIVVGPSNPIASIGPILAVPGMREAIAGAAAPVVAVSPIVGGRVLKGPTAEFMRFASLPVSAEGVAACYGDLLDGIVADEELSGLACLRTDTAMVDAPSRSRLARETFEFARGLRR